jgi:tetratricopeptide (TPR) repeat protein
MRVVHYIIISVVLLGVAASSFLLVPSQRELALMHLIDKDYDAARRLYAAPSIGDDLDVSVVVPMTELYLQNADVRSAVSLVERFVRNNPNNLSALRRLDQLYRYSQRPDDVLANLEKICSLQPTVDELRELSNIYNFESKYAKQIEVLKKLERAQPGNPQNLLDLAYLQASQGLINDAAQSMREYESRHPGAVNDASVEFRVSLLLDSSKAEEAFSRAKFWISQHRDPELIARLVNLFHFKAQPAVALRLLEPLENLLIRSPALLAQYIELQIVTGHSEKAYVRLRNLDDARKLPDDLSPAYINLCLEHKETLRALETARRGPMDRLPDWLVLHLAETLVSTGNAGHVRGIHDSLGEEFLRRHPVFAAQMAMALQDKPAAERWVAVAEQQPELPTDQTVALAGLYASLGRSKKALERLSLVAETPDIPDISLLDLARLYLETDEAPQGLPLFLKLRKARPSSNVEAGWALLSAGAGDSAPVEAWLKDRLPKQPDNRILRDLYYISQERGSTGLCLAVAEELFRRIGGRDERFLLGRALLAAHRYVEAVPHLRTLVPGSPEEESAYVEALTAVASKSDKLREELRTYLATKLSDPAASRTRREDLVRALLELKDYTTALPVAAEFARKGGGDWFSLYVESALASGRKSDLFAFLVSELKRKDLPLTWREERMHVLLDNGGTAEGLSFLREYAEKSGGEWASAYEDTLQRLNRKTELYATWRRRLDRRDTSPSDKRDIGYRALEAGQKELAEYAFRALAANAPPDSPDVSQLLFIWGPRPGPSGLDWMESRARASSGDELASWMQHLIDTGGAKRAATVACDRLPAPGKGGPVFEAYLSALASIGNRTELTLVLDREIPAESRISSLRRFSQLAREMDLTSTAKSALEKILAIAPADPEALRSLGTMAFSSANYALAKDYLSRYLESCAGDVRSHWIFGELALRDGNPALARKHFESSLRQINAEARPDREIGIIRARLLFRLGRIREALTLSEQLLTEAPTDKNLRADLVAAMLDAGLAEQARSFLETRATLASVMPAARGGSGQK